MTSFDHTQFRQYASQLARWISPDPAGLLVADPSNPQSWNRYAYVLNNPLNFIDPFGLVGTCSIGSYSDFQLCIDAGGTWTNDPTDPCGANTNTCINVGEPPPAAIPTTDVPLPDQLPGGNSSGGGSIFQRIKNAVCSALPSGRVVSLGGSAGTLGGATGSLDVVTNYGSGQVTAFASGGFFAGFNGGGSAQASYGGIYGNLAPNNSNFAGRFKTASASVGFFGGSIAGSNQLIVLSGSLSKSLFGPGTFAGSTTTSTPLLQVGNFLNGTAPALPSDFLYYVLRLPCN